MARGELMVIFGPPAVGKMIVGRAVCDRTDFRLFLNHHTIEPLAEVFGQGTQPFATLNGEFRRRVVEESAASGLRLILTQVWNLQGVEDAAWVSALVSPYVEAGLRVSFVELAADIETRLMRNRGEDRLRAKPSKRDVAWSEAHLHEREETMVMNPTLSCRWQQTRCWAPTDTCGWTTSISSRSQPPSGSWPGSTRPSQLIGSVSLRRRTLPTQAFEPSSAASLRKNGVPRPSGEPTRPGRVGPSQP